MTSSAGLIGRRAVPGGQRLVFSAVDDPAQPIFHRRAVLFVSSAASTRGPCLLGGAPAPRWCAWRWSAPDRASQPCLRLILPDVGGSHGLSLVQLLGLLPVVTFSAPTYGKDGGDLLNNAPERPAAVHHAEDPDRSPAWQARSVELYTLVMSGDVGSADAEGAAEASSGHARRPYLRREGAQARHLASDGSANREQMEKTLHVGLRLARGRWPTQPSSSLGRNDLARQAWPRRYLRRPGLFVADPLGGRRRRRRVASLANDLVVEAVHRPALGVGPGALVTRRAPRSPGHGQCRRRLPARSSSSGEPRGLRATALAPDATRGEPAWRAQARTAGAEGSNDTQGRAVLTRSPSAGGGARPFPARGGGEEARGSSGRSRHVHLRLEPGPRLSGQPRSLPQHPRLARRPGRRDRHPAQRQPPKPDRPHRGREQERPVALDRRAAGRRDGGRDLAGGPSPPHQTGDGAMLEDSAVLSVLLRLAASS